MTLLTPFPSKPIENSQMVPFLGPATGQERPSRIDPTEHLVRKGDSTRQAKIMIVDDEPVNVKVVLKHLKQAGFLQFVTTSESCDALHLIRSERPDVILLDINMPGVSGLQILEVIRGDRQLHHLPVLIMTATGDDETKDTALALGATDFLAKPLRPIELLARIRNSLVLKAHHDHLAAYSNRLEAEVYLRTIELAQSRQELIRVLACASEFRDSETGNHVVRVGKYARVLAEQVGLSKNRVELIEQAAVLHDVGKIAIPDAILQKPARLTPEEMETMKRHCEFGRNILLCHSGDGTTKSAWSVEGQNQLSPVLQTAATIAISHHEKWDGTGYPFGLIGDAIPIEGRIVAVADVFDAIRSKRCYKDAMPLEKCLELIGEGSGKHFDPRLVTAFFQRIDEILSIESQLR